MRSPPSFEIGTSVARQNPVAFVINLRATGGDPLAFNRRDDEAVMVRKSTNAERKAENFRRVGRKHRAVE